MYYVFSDKVAVRNLFTDIYVDYRYSAQNI